MYDGITENNLIYQKINDRWDVGVFYDVNKASDNISFVNGINTYLGGRHVEYVYKNIH